MFSPKEREVDRQESVMVFLVFTVFPLFRLDGWCLDHPLHRWCVVLRRSAPFQSTKQDAQECGASTHTGSREVGILERRKFGHGREIHNPDTPWDCHICLYIGVVLGINVGIYGSPMECLGKVLLVSIDGSWMMVDVCGGWAGEAIVVSLES